MTHEDEGTAHSTGFAPCKKGSRYVQQLVSHWRHRMSAVWVDGHAEFLFDDGTIVQMDTDQGGITIKLKARDVARDGELRPVIETHLNRFAFREAPLSFSWSLTSSR